VTNSICAVADTNVFISAALSKNPSSPTREVVERRKTGQFILLICAHLADEIVEKLLDHSIAKETVIELVELLTRLAEWVEIAPERIEALLSGPDDDVVIACAAEGAANYLVTYDPHFDSLGGEYRGVKILKAIPFLEVLRKATA
jgi:putative PIN family toxin of toxin-antitoxin system